MWARGHWKERRIVADMNASVAMATRSFSAGHYFSCSKRPATSSPAVTRETNRSWAIHVSLLLLGSLSLHGKGNGKRTLSAANRFPIIGKNSRAESASSPERRKQSLGQQPSHSGCWGRDAIGGVNTRHRYHFPLPSCF